MALKQAGSPDRALDNLKNLLPELEALSRTCTRIRDCRCRRHARQLWRQIIFAQQVLKSQRVSERPASSACSRMLGNFPQAYSHVGLINCALNLSREACPAEERAESRTGRTSEKLSSAE